MSAAIFNQGLFHAFSVGPFDGTLYELSGQPAYEFKPYSWYRTFTRWLHTRTLRSGGSTRHRTNRLRPTEPVL